MSLSAIGLACETSRCDYATRTLSGSMDEFNVRSTDLRFDIGFDSALAKRAGGFINIKTLCDAIIQKTNGLMPQEYAKENY